MAKVSGPLMSLSASGKFGGALVASIWKGRPYMRQLVTPANPKTTGQKTVRSVLGTLAKAAHAVLTSFADSMDAGSAFFKAARDNAPTGQSWISWMQRTLYPLFSARRTEYMALSSTIKGYYDSAAGTIGLASYVDKAGVTQTAGFQLYMLGVFATLYLGYTFTGGIDAPGSLTPCTALGTYVHTTS